MNKVTFIIYFSSPRKERDAEDFAFANTIGNKTDKHDRLLPQLSDGCFILRGTCFPLFWIWEMLPLIPSSDTHLFLFHGDWGTREQRVMYTAHHTFTQNQDMAEAVTGTQKVASGLAPHFCPTCCFFWGTQWESQLLLDTTALISAEKKIWRKKKKDHTNVKRPIFCSKTQYEQNVWINSAWQESLPNMTGSYITRIMRIQLR